jgi:hypothetical protein
MLYSYAISVGFHADRVARFTLQAEDPEEADALPLTNTQLACPGEGGATCNA